MTAWNLRPTPPQEPKSVLSSESAVTTEPNENAT